MILSSQMCCLKESLRETCYFILLHKCYLTRGQNYGRVFIKSPLTLNPIRSHSVIETVQKKIASGGGALDHFKHHHYISEVSIKGLYPLPGKVSLVGHTKHIFKNFFHLFFIPTSTHPSTACQDKFPM